MRCKPRCSARRRDSASRSQFYARAAATEDPLRRSVRGAAYSRTHVRPSDRDILRIRHGPLPGGAVRGSLAPAARGRRQRRLGGRPGARGRRAASAPGAAGSRLAPSRAAPRSAARRRAGVPQPASRAVGPRSSGARGRPTPRRAPACALAGDADVCGARALILLRLAARGRQAGGADARRGARRSMAAASRRWRSASRATSGRLGCCDKTGGVLLSRALASQVPSALRGLTALFGMGRGVSPSPKPPERLERPSRSFKTAQRHIGAWGSRVSKRSIDPSSPRPISTGLLRTSPSFQIRPINLVVYQGSYSLEGMGELISRSASRLDAFSGYPIRT
jgi:hypothetical protein